MTDGAKPHTLDIRVYFEDTDFSGHVYHATLVKFMERGRTEFLRDADIHHSDLIKTGVFFVVRNLNVTFHAPAKIDDFLRVETHLDTAKGARMMLDQSIWLADKKIADGQVEVALVGANGRPMRLPNEFLALSAKGNSA